MLERRFFSRNPEVVAEELIGKVLVRSLGGRVLSGKIVETEAYYGEKDPASRAKRKGSIRERMLGDPGFSLIYGVHGNWLLNVVTGPRGFPSAVLIRAIEPIDGIEEMLKRRKSGIRELTNGPGKLTEAMGITKELDGIDLTSGNSLLRIEDRGLPPGKILRSHRIGVKEDMDRPLRFFSAESEFVSRR